jgi:NAD(P)-dependent dehydrogenase (short-subunit alcohol dehydrogenase family)
MGKKILITGGASGKGLELVKELAAQQSNQVYFTYCHSAGSALQLMTAFKNTQGYRCDYTDDDSLSTFISRIHAVELDVVIHAAKAAVDANTLSPALLHEKKFQTYLRPVIVITTELLKKFRQQQSGKIITLLPSAVDSFTPATPLNYFAENMYLLGLSRSWAIENAAYNIQSEVLSYPATGSVHREAFRFNLNKLITEKSNFDEIGLNGSLVNEVVRRVEAWN